VLFSHGPNKEFLVPDSCRVTERNGNSIKIFEIDVLTSQMIPLKTIRTTLA